MRQNCDNDNFGQTEFDRGMVGASPDRRDNFGQTEIDNLDRRVLVADAPVRVAGHPRPPYGRGVACATDLNEKIKYK